MHDSQTPVLKKENEKKRNPTPFTPAHVRVCASTPSSPKPLNLIQPNLFEPFFVGVLCEPLVLLLADIILQRLLGREQIHIVYILHPHHCPFAVAVVGIFVLAPVVLVVITPPILVVGLVEFDSALAGDLVGHVFRYTGVAVSPHLHSHHSRGVALFV